jgi:hypothetical protein
MPDGQPAEPVPTDEQLFDTVVRTLALGLTVLHLRDRSSGQANDVVGWARVFEQYLRGEEP